MADALTRPSCILHGKSGKLQATEEDWSLVLPRRTRSGTKNEDGEPDSFVVLRVLRGSTSGIVHFASAHRQIASLRREQGEPSCCRRPWDVKTCGARAVAARALHQPRKIRPTRYSERKRSWCDGLDDLDPGPVRVGSGDFGPDVRLRGLL